MLNFVTRQLNAVSVTCCSAGAVWFFPELAEVIKAVVQALFVVACYYMIKGKEQHLEWAEIRGYRTMKTVYLHFLMLGIVTLAHELMPYLSLPHPADPGVWVSWSTADILQDERFRCRVCWLFDLSVYHQLLGA